MAKTLLEKAQAVGGALLVMGAHGHRAGERVFGGVTRAILAQAGSPVFMAHRPIMSGRRAPSVAWMASATSQWDLAFG